MLLGDVFQKMSALLLISTRQLTVALAFTHILSLFISLHMYGITYTYSAYSIFCKSLTVDTWTISAGGLDHTWNEKVGWCRWIKRKICLYFFKWCIKYILVSKCSILCDYPVRNTNNSDLLQMHGNSFSKKVAQNDPSKNKGSKYYQTHICKFVCVAIKT